MSLRVLIAVTLLPAALVMGQADAPPEAVVGRLVEAARKGNAAGIKLLLAPGSAGSQTTINRWADDLAKAGPNLPADQLVDPQQSLIAGDFAVVRGGPPPGTLTRLRKINNQWKVLIPGDAAANYGLDRMVALNLSSLEKRAEREWKDAPAPTAPSQNGSTATPGAAPGNTAPADNADPVRHPNNPAITRALPEFIALIPEIGKLQMPSSIVDNVIEALLDAGEVSAAEQVFRAAPRKDLIHAGELAVRSPGGVNGPAGKEILALARATPGQTGTQLGIATGLARMGQHDQAAAIARRQGRPLAVKLIGLRPDRAYLALILPPAAPYDDTTATTLIRSLVVLGEEQAAREVADRYREKSIQTNPLDGIRADQQISIARFFAMLYRGDLDQAATFPDEYFAAAMQPGPLDDNPEFKRRLESAARHKAKSLREVLLAAYALRGDLAQVQAAIAKLDAYHGGAFDPRILAVNAHARHGDAAAIDQAVATLDARNTKSEQEHAILYGLAVHGAHAAGNESLVNRYTDAFLKHIETDVPVTKLGRLSAFLRAAARGPTEALDMDSLDAFPLD